VKRKKANTFPLVIQEGGSTGEVYVHGFYSLRDARRFRVSAARAAYRTSAPIHVPIEFEEHLDVIEDIVKASLSPVYPQDDHL
jgi:hypothetical protein